MRRAVMDKTKNEKGAALRANLAANMPDVLKRPTLTDLEGRLSGRAGFIVGSGPGLEKNGQLLRQVNGRGLILAAGSALKPLLEIGVAPEIVVVIEAEDTSGFLCRVGTGPPAILALASTSHPNHFGAAGFIGSVCHLTSGDAYLCGAEGFVPQGGTAGSAAFSLGLLLGLNPLVLVGQDQAYGAEALHARGTPGEEPACDDAGVFSVVGIDGGPVRTHSGFAASLHWYAEAIRYLRRKEPKRILINANENGARIPGLPDMTLREVLDRCPRPEQPPPDLGELLAGLKGPAPDLVRERLIGTWRLTTQLSRLLREAPAQAGPILEECRRVHPFLSQALPGPAESKNLSDVAAAIAGIETLTLKMLEAVDRYEE